MARNQSVALTGIVSPRQRIWDAIRAQQGKEWTRTQIISSTCDPGTMRNAVDPGTVGTYLQCLLKAGIIEITHKTQSNRVRGAAASHTYRLVKNTGVEAPRVKRDGSRVTSGLCNEQMWRAMRILKGDFNADELAAYASSRTVQVVVKAASDYIKNLYRAGYLECMKPASHGTGKGGIKSRYRLRPDRNTGPKPPMVCKTKSIYDANENRVVWAAPVSEDDADE